MRRCSEAERPGKLRPPPASHRPHSHRSHSHRSSSRSKDQRSTDHKSADHKSTDKRRCEPTLFCLAGSLTLCGALGVLAVLHGHWAVRSLSRAAEDQLLDMTERKRHRGEGPVAFSHEGYSRRAPALDAGTRWPGLEGGVAEASLALARKDAGRPALHHFGINLPIYVKKDFYMGPGVNLLVEGGFKLLRFPGGSVADNYVWNADYETFPFFREWEYMTGPEFLHTEDLVELCRKAGAEPVVQINYAAFVTNALDEAIQLVIRWQQRFITLGFPVKYWEFGNENFAPWEVPTDHKYANVTGELYGEHLGYLSKAMKAVDSEVSLGAVVVDNERGDGTGERGKGWMKGLVPHLPGAADFTILHSYFFQPMNWSKDGGEYNLPTTQQVFTADAAPVVADLRTNLDALLVKYSPGLKLPSALTEWNVDQAFPHADTVTNEHVSALATADLLGQMIKFGGFDAACYFALSDAFRETGPEGEHNPGPGDLGLIARKDNTTAENTPRPAWYAFAVMQRAMGDHLVQAVSSDPEVTAYASTFAGGEVGLVIINRKSRGVRLHLENLASFIPGGPTSRMRWEARGWVVDSAAHGAEDPGRSRGSRWNGAVAKSGVGGPFPISSIKSYAAEIKVDWPAAFFISWPAALHIPAVSLSGVVLYPQGSGEQQQSSTWLSGLLSKIRFQ